MPNPFVLGRTRPPPAGQHTVDYYSYTGTALDVAKPQTSYSWTIADEASSVTPTTKTTPADTTTAALTTTTTAASSSTVSASVTALPAATPDFTHSIGYSEVLDPNGSGRTVSLRRITSDGALYTGGQRCESFYRQPQYRLIPGRDYWMSFAVMMKPGDSITSGDGTMLVFQTHTPADGNTTPDISVNFKGQTNQAFHVAAYNTKPSDTWNWVGGPNPDTEKETDVTTEAMPAIGKWTRYIVHYRPGYMTSHAPRLEVWRAYQGQDYVKVTDHSGLNTYNSLAGASYPRIGPYKWSSSAWGSSSQSFYMTPLHFGEGTNLLAAAKAALQGL